jgi:hypothetical protein
VLFTFHWYTGAVPPFVGVAVKVTEVAGQMVVAEALTATEGVGAGVTVMFMGLLVADIGEAQTALDVTVTVTASLLFKVAEEKLELLPPTILPFTFHWYTAAVPPFMAVALKVTGVPGQMVVADGDTVTEGMTASLTVMVN